MIALLVGLTYPLLLLTASAILAALLHREGRRARRHEAQRAEQHARPPSTRPLPVDEPNTRRLHTAIHRQDRP